MSVLYLIITSIDSEIRVIMITTKTDNENQYRLGGGLMVNRLGFGTMQLTGPGVWGEPADRAAAKRILTTAVEKGVNFFDTADSYGPATVEQLIRESISSWYDTVTIATKGGLERGGPGQWFTNGHPDHIARTIDESLKRLGKGQLQLWQLHRVDPRYPVEESLAPVAKAVRDGKILKVGLSEVNIATIERAAKVVPIASVQNLYNLGDRSWESVIDYTARQNIAFIPWFPLASGPEKLRSRVKDIAARHQTSVAGIALAFLLRRSPNILLIPGTSSLTHLNENLEAAKIQLTPEEYKTLLEG